jgi:putative flippase GtrA
MAPPQAPSRVSAKDHQGVDHWIEASVGLAAILPQLSCYAAVSAAALALDFALYVVLTNFDLWPVLAGVVAYAAGTALHYLLSVRFVFDASATDKAHARLLAEFAVTGASGGAVTALVIAAATDLFGIAALSAKVLAATGNFLLVFTLRRYLVFSARRRDDLGLERSFLHRAHSKANLT